MTIRQAHLAFPHGLGSAWPLVHPDFPIAICWSYKSANTTMLKWFLFQIGLLDRAQAECPDRLHLFWHAHITAMPDYGDLCCHALAESTRTTTVKIVRDPADRAVSSFLHFIRDPEEVFHDTWAAFLDWKDARSLPRTPWATFAQFLRFICDCRAAGTPLDHHLQPQWNPSQDPFVEQLIPLERLGPEIRRLERQHGLRESPLADLSQSPHHRPSVTRECWPARAADMPLDGRRMRRLGGPPTDVLLDDTTRPLIHEAFAEDYAGYGRFYAAVRPARKTPALRVCL